MSKGIILVLTCLVVAVALWAVAAAGDSVSFIDEYGRVCVAERDWLGNHVREACR